MTNKYCPNCEGPLIDVIDVYGMSENHQAVLSEFVTKYKEGVREHGDLSFDVDWTPAMIHEQIDYTFYLIFQLMYLRNKAGKEAQDEPV
jgi:hypothetical protein